MPASTPSTPRHQAVKRRTIGLLTARTGRVWGREFMAGVTDAARAFDLSLRCFVCREVAGSGFSLYNLVDPASLDGLILAADLGHGVSQDQIERLCARFHPLPMVALSLEVPGIPTIQTDSFNGMRQAVLHLIETHGLRRIAFIRGPQGQSEAEQRYRAYVSALEASGIPLDQALVVPGDFNPASGRAAISLLLDERQADLQAVNEGRHL